MIKNKRGITLVETVIALGIVSLFISASIVFLIFMFNSDSRIALEHEIHWQAWSIMQEVRERVEGAEIINIPAKGNSGNSVRINYPFDSSMEEVEIFEDSGNIFLVEGNNSAVKLNSEPVKVGSVVFSNLSPDEGATLGFEISLNASKSQVAVEEYFYTTIVSFK